MAIIGKAHFYASSVINGKKVTEMTKEERKSFAEKLISKGTKLVEFHLDYEVEVYEK